MPKLSRIALALVRLVPRSTVEDLLGEFMKDATCLVSPPLPSGLLLDRL